MYMNGSEGEKLYSCSGRSIKKSSVPGAAVAAVPVPRSGGDGRRS